MLIRLNVVIISLYMHHIAYLKYIQILLKKDGSRSQKINKIDMNYMNT